MRQIPSRATDLGLDFETCALSEIGETTAAVALDGDLHDERKLRRRKESFAKHRRMSLWAAASQESGQPLLHRQSLFATRNSLVTVEESQRKSLHSRVHQFPGEDAIIEEESSESGQNFVALSLKMKAFYPKSFLS